MIAASPQQMQRRAYLRCVYCGIIDVRALHTVSQMTDCYLGSRTSFIDAGYCLDNQARIEWIST